MRAADIIDDEHNHKMAEHLPDVVGGGYDLLSQMTRAEGFGWLLKTEGGRWQGQSRCSAWHGRGKHGFKITKDPLTLLSSGSNELRLPRRRTLWLVGRCP